MAGPRVCFSCSVFLVFLLLYVQFGDCARPPLVLCAVQPDVLPYVPPEQNNLCPSPDTRCASFRCLHWLSVIVDNKAPTSNNSDTLAFNKPINGTDTTEKVFCAALCRVQLARTKLRSCIRFTAQDWARTAFYTTNSQIASHLHISPLNVWSAGAILHNHPSPFTYLTTEVHDKQQGQTASTLPFDLSANLLYRQQLGSGHNPWPSTWNYRWMNVFLFAVFHLPARSFVASREGFLPPPPANKTANVTRHLTVMQLSDEL